MRLLVTETLGSGATSQDGIYVCTAINKVHARKAWVYKYAPDFDFSDIDFESELPDEFETNDGAIFHWNGCTEIPEKDYEVFKKYIPELDTGGLDNCINKN